jgi:hypothetical protein
MPKVGGKNIDQCMSICMDDPKTKGEYPNVDDRQRVCYAACSDRFDSDEEAIEAIIEKWKEKSRGQ